MTTDYPKAARKVNLLRDFRGLIACGFGSGLAPIAPGTFGTVAALPCCFALGHFLPLWAYVTVWAGVFAVGCWASAWVIRELQREDPGVIVIDEWVGMAITWAAVCYWPNAHSNWVYLAPAFLAFRLADIAKVWPASFVDKNVHGGFGAMLDDAIAGIWGALAVSLMLYLNVLPVSM
jgi:phosphatidylglycerophosphatase A